MCKVIDIFTKQEVKQDKKEKVNINNKINLENDYCSITYFEKDKQIAGSDLTDKYNLPCFFTRNKRSIKKAWAELKEEFNKNTKMYDAMNILNKFNMNCHSYDSMD